MMKITKLLVCLTFFLASVPVVRSNDDGLNGNDQYQNGNDYIKYWTDYAILPKRCIVYNDVDVIVFSVFEHAYKQCSDEPKGTYIVPVPLFVTAYMNQLTLNKADTSNDDWEIPASASYTSCTQVKVQEQIIYVQLGCTDGTSQSVSVNIYTDNTCETRDETDGYDDSNIDVSDIQPPFKQCKACVNFIDMSDDNLDDKFFENRQMNAPLCSILWQNKEVCDRKCQKPGLDRREKDDWNTSDKMLLSILVIFDVGMLVAILRKRTQMSNKDALLEQAAMTAAGLQQVHVIGIFILVSIIITVFALLELKNVTWILLLIMNTTLFGYLMKLTIDSGVSTGETVIGPDGTIIQRGESDDSSVESGVDGKAGTYTMPTIT